MAECSRGPKRPEEGHEEDYDPNDPSAVYASACSSVRSSASGSRSTRFDAAAAAAAAAAEAAATAAALRGEGVGASGAAAAPLPLASGECARLGPPRGWLSLYTDGSSPAALEVANGIMSRVQLPGGVVFQVVGPESVEFQMGAIWQFPSFAVALGSSYFQRLLIALPHLAAAARRCPAFAAYCRGAPPMPTAPAAAQASPAELAAVESTLRSAQFTCIFLATKVADQVQLYGLLRFMLTALTGQRYSVSAAQAIEVELRCLEGLGWRLGPYFAEDDL